MRFGLNLKLNHPTLEIKRRPQEFLLTKINPTKSCCWYIWKVTPLDMTRKKYPESNKRVNLKCISLTPDENTSKQVVSAHEDIHTHTHTHIYIYIYIWRLNKKIILCQLNYHDKKFRQYWGHSMYCWGDLIKTAVQCSVCRIEEFAGFSHHGISIIII